MQDPGIRQVRIGLHVCQTEFTVIKSLPIPGRINRPLLSDNCHSIEIVLSRIIRDRHRHQNIMIPDLHIHVKLRSRSRNDSIGWNRRNALQRHAHLKHITASHLMQRIINGNAIFTRTLMNLSSLAIYGKSDGSTGNIRQCNICISHRNSYTDTHKSSVREPRKTLHTQHRLLRHILQFKIIFTRNGRKHGSRRQNKQ